MILSLKYLQAFLYASLLLCSASACQLTIEPSNLNINANSGDKSSAVCSCSLNPNANYRFTWYRYGSLLVNMDRVHLEVTGPDRIFFKRVLVEDEGEYICVATDVHSSITFNTSLMVYVAPQLADNSESKQLSIGVGSSLELPCPVKSLEEHSTLELIWTLPSLTRLSVDNQQSGSFNIVQETKGLLIRDAKLSDTGEYNCYASNMAGGVTFIWNISVKDFIRESTPQTDRRLTITTDDDVTTSFPRTTTGGSNPIRDTTVSSLLSSPLYLTLIIIAFIITCTLIFITFIISITCICVFCHHSKLLAEDTSASSTHKIPPLPPYSTCMSTYPQHGPSPATSYQSLGSQHSTRRIGVQPPCSVAETTSMDSPNGQPQNLLVPSSFKHVRYSSDQGEYNLVSSSQAELACPRCCPSVTMSEPRTLYANSPRLTPRLQPKKHSLPDRIEDPHPLTQTQYSTNTPYLHFPANTVQQVDV